MSLLWNAIWKHLGAILKASWAALGALLGLLGVLLEASWDLLGPLGNLLGSSWGPLAALSLQL